MLIEPKRLQGYEVLNSYLKIVVFSSRLFLQEITQFCLFSKSFALHHYDDKLTLFRFLNTHSIDLIIIDADWNKNAHNCIYTWRICQSRDNVPIIVFCGLANQDDMSNAFENGADDIIAWPYKEDEIIARVRQSLLKRKPKVHNRNLIIEGSFTLNQEALQLLHFGEDLLLTRTEFKIAWALFTNFGALTMREQIAECVWNKDFLIVQQTLDQHIYKLRKKLLSACASEVKVVTIYGLGYKVIKACT